ncbi:MAG: two-component system response regulator [Rhodobiaceae bacterium]|nr:MAG: two-component system response regulator [Rhodobiaceae bacterium]
MPMDNVDLTKLTFLIAEDNSFMLSQLRQQLRGIGTGALFEAQDGEEAFALLCAKKPNFVIIDSEMEPVSGLAFVRQARTSKDNPNPQVPIIVLVATPSAAKLTEARDVGATEILTKPVSVKLLTGRIQHILKNQRQFIHEGSFAGPDRRRKLIDGAVKTERRHP